MAKQKDLSSESKATLLWNSGSSDAESTPVASSSLAGRSLPRFEKVSWRTREGISTMASASSSSTRRAGGTTVFVIAGQNLPVAPHTYIRKSSSAAPQTLPVSADPVFACAGMLLTTARVVSAESKARRGQAAREVVSSARARMTNFPGEARTCMRTCCIHCSGGFAGASRNAAGPAVACVASMLSFHDSYMSASRQEHNEGNLWTFSFREQAVQRICCPNPRVFQNDFQNDRHRNLSPFLAMVFVAIGTILSRKPCTTVQGFPIWCHARRQGMRFQQSRNRNQLTRAPD